MHNYLPVTRRRRAGLLFLAMIGLATAACSWQPGGQVAQSAPAAPADLVFVIPPGTFASEMRGEPSFSLPPTIRLVTGQAIVIRNSDQAMHYFFDIPVPPGQSIQKTFNRPGTFGFSPGLSCSIARDGSTTIEVSPG
jgi:hypothetical protein